MRAPSSRPRGLLLALLFATAGGMLAVPSVASAQPTEEDIAVLREEARELYRKGMTRFRNQQFAQARASFLAAWSLEPHWSLALALGDCAMKLDRPRDAAQHLSFALRGMPEYHPSRAPAQKAFDDVRLRVATLQLDVDREGAEVRLDGIRIGTSPLEDPAFVEPGRRTVEARFPDRDPAVVTVDAVAGATHPVRLQLDTPSSEGSLGATNPPPSETREQPSSNTKSIVLWTGLGLGVAAAGVGLAYTLKASSASDDISSLQGQIDQELGPAGCAASTSPLCSDLDARFDDKNRASSRATIGWVASGVLLGATSVVYFAWPEERREMALVPVIGPNAAMISWQGRLP